MARIVNAQYATLIGTPPQLKRLLELLRGSRASIVDLRFSNIVVLDEPLTQEQLQKALQTTPRSEE